jgi:hypothetical protein
MVLGQLRQRRLDRAPKLAAKRRLPWVRVRHARQQRTIPRDLALLVKRALVEVQVLPPAGAPNVVDRSIHDDTIEPSLEARAPLKFVYVLVDLDESLLNGIQSIIFVFDDTHGHGKRATMILIEERPKSR